MSSSNLKIFLSITLSLVIFFGANYILKNPEQTKNTLYQAPNIIVSSIKTLNPLPFFSQITKKVFNSQTTQLANSQNTINNNPNSFNLPTSSFQFTPPSPTPTQKIIFQNLLQTSNSENLENTIYQKKSKPTSTPKPSPTPLAPKEYLRPGSGLEDIFKKAADISCVPVNLLKAFVANEAPGVLMWSDEKALFYNAYDWWHRVTKKEEVCAGYGWFPETGLIAEDSLFAGERCKAPFSEKTANDTVSRALGATQMLEYYWNKSYADKVKKKLNVDKVDRRVLIDSLIGFGLSIRENGHYTGGCEGWDFKDVVKAACINQGGSCGPYYCNVICRNYNKYAGTNFNCEVNMNNLFVSGKFCEFK